MSAPDPSRLAECERLCAELPLFVGDDLGRDVAGAERARWVREHLKGCARCRRHASALQQARKALQQFGRATPDGVDEEFFTDLHERVLSETVHAPIGGAWRDRVSIGRLSGLAAAAMLLFALGFWLVDLSTGDSVLRRPPLVLDASAPRPDGGRDDLVRAVPYAGGVELKLLGYQDGGAVGQGMAGRLDLRLLGDEARLPSRQTGGATTGGAAADGAAQHR